MTAETKHALLSIVSELQCENSHLQDAYFNMSEKYDVATGQLRQAEFNLEQAKRLFDKQQHDCSLQAIDTFKQETLSGLIDKIKTLKQLHFAPCKCGNDTVSQAGQDEYQQDVIPQMLQNWMEATEKVDQTMRKIELKVKDDFKQMSSKIDVQLKKIEDQNKQIDELKSKHENTQIAYLEIK